MTDHEVKCEAGADQTPEVALHKEMFHATGAVEMEAAQFKSFKVADNLCAGIEFEMTWDAGAHEKCYIDGALIVGRSPNGGSNEIELQSSHQSHVMFHNTAMNHIS